MDSRTLWVLSDGLAGGKGLSRCPRRTVLVLWPNFHLKACLCFGQCNPVCISVICIVSQTQFYIFSSYTAFQRGGRHGACVGSLSTLSPGQLPGGVITAGRVQPRSAQLSVRPEMSHTEEGPGGPLADRKIRQTKWGLNYCCRENNKLIIHICTYHGFLVLHF